MLIFMCAWSSYCLQKSTCSEKLLIKPVHVYVFVFFFVPFAWFCLSFMHSHVYMCVYGYVECLFSLHFVFFSLLLLLLLRSCIFQRGRRCLRRLINKIGGLSFANGLKINLRWNNFSLEYTHAQVKMMNGRFLVKFAFCLYVCSNSVSHLHYVIMRINALVFTLTSSFMLKCKKCPRIECSFVFMCVCFYHRRSRSRGRHHSRPLF